MAAQRQVSDSTRRAEDAASVRVGENLERLSDVEVDRRVRAGAEAWEELLDRLVAAGMLPSRELAARVESFLGEGYRRAEQARVEGLRRWMLAEAAQTPRVIERSWGRDGR